MSGGAAPEHVSRITLRALQGEPLKQQRVREMIAATAHAIAERQGIPVIEMDLNNDCITVALGTGRIEAIGFAAELRRLTTRWYTQKFGMETLWGEPPPEEGEQWKSGGGS
jgi:hypothetical protein